MHLERERPAPGRGIVAINVVVAALFLISAGLQLNDPDPVRWIAVYVAAAVACLLHGRVPGHRWLSGAVALASLVWAVTLSGVLPDLRVADLFKTMKAEQPTIELGREFFGLLIVCAWMVFLTVRGRSRHPAGDG